MITELRIYKLKEGKSKQFIRTFEEQSFPMLKRWNVNVVAYGFSEIDPDSFYLIRNYESIEQRKESQDAFYSSEEWINGPEKQIMDCIESYNTSVIENKILKEQTTLTPFLTVNNGKKAVDFFISTWGAVEITRYNISDNTLISKISIEGAEFWVGDEEPQCGNLCPDLKSNNTVRIILETKNADELFEKALKLGATEICPMTTENLWRIGKLKDPFGHIWEIGYPL